VEWSGTGTHAPAQDVEAFGQGVDGYGDRAEGDAKAHHAAGALRVLERELVRRKGAEIFAHQERLHRTRPRVASWQRSASVCCHGRANVFGLVQW